MLQIYNSLSRQLEKFKPIKKEEVTLYSCGPTVYNYAHIGNLRTYLFNDFLKRSLTYLGYKVNHAMNLTDVDDKTIRGSQQAQTSLKAFTQKYEHFFFADCRELNIITPTKVVRATDYIEDMIKLIQKLLKKEYAYAAEDGIYFSIKKFKTYGELAQLKKTKTKKARIKSDEYDKEHAQDFALWKFYTPTDGDVFWDAPFGRGRPGWHIECSAMSMEALAQRIDIHTGAIDLLFPHHTNEIAQSEAATGKQFVKYWLHAGFLTLKEGKMSKSLGNILTLNELKKENYHPLHYRYLCLLTHYRKPLLFNLDNLEAAKNTYERLKRKVIELRTQEHKGTDTKQYESQFTAALEDDLNIPLGIQIMWKVLDDFDIDAKKKLSFLEKIDTVLGLDIVNMREQPLSLSEDVQELVAERESMRQKKKWAEADILRQRIKERGYTVLDTPQGPKLEKI